MTVTLGVHPGELAWVGVIGAALLVILWAFRWRGLVAWVLGGLAWLARTQHLWRWPK